MADLRASLTRIYEVNGELTPQAVVDDARPAKSELHNRFEWDNEIAGEAHRCTQAAEIIRSVRIMFSEEGTGERKFVRAFHSVRLAGDDDRGGYAPTEEIIQDEVATKILLRECKREIADLKRKYGHLEDFVHLIRQETDGIAS